MGIHGGTIDTAVLDSPPDAERDAADLPSIGIPGGVGWTVRAKGQDEAELLSLANRIPHDDRIHRGARLEDLSKPLIKEFLQTVGSGLAAQVDLMTLEELGRAMHIVGGPPEHPCPKNIGLMFFNEHPENFFPVTQIDVVWFPEGRGGDQFTEKEFRGPLHRMLADALDYIERRYIEDLVTKHPDRAEATRVQNFPMAAIEEALANAIYHRSYEEREPVEVQIERDEMIIISYPGPDRSVRLDELQAGRARPRRYRNRRIGDFLKELDITEGRGTGIPKILKAMAANGSPPPVFEFDEDHSYFMVRLPVHAEAAGKDMGVPRKLGVESQLESQLESGVESGMGRQVLQLLHQKTLGKLEIARLLGKDRSSRYLNDLMKKLLESGTVEYTIPDKPNSRNQRYRLTPAGRDLLGKLKSGDD